MQTYLIISQNSDYIKRKINNIKKINKIKKFNVHKISPDPSIGIDQVKKIQHLFTTKPYERGTRLVILENTAKATIQAQNALLKLLEEPPKGNLIILISPSQEMLLDTVLSRCQIIKEKTTQPRDEKHKETLKFIKTILTSGKGKRLLISQKKSTSREEAVSMLESIIEVFECELKKKQPSLPADKEKIASLLKKTSSALGFLNMNINVKATMDLLFLGY